MIWLDIDLIYIIGGNYINNNNNYYYYTQPASYIIFRVVGVIRLVNTSQQDSAMGIIMVHNYN